jgi:hypothetical protein
MPPDYTAKPALNDVAGAEWETYVSAVTECFADIEPEPINWLWRHRIARGKVTLLVGDPGVNKSLATLDMTARITRGEDWPVDGGKAPLGDVLVLSAEDDPADTIRPRLDAAGADVSHVYLLKAVREIDKDGKLVSRHFSLKCDLERLSDVLVRHPQCVLVIVDPISAYLDGTDSHNNAEIRGLLAPLSELAMRHKVAVLCVTHLNKSNHANPMYRTTGSLAFNAAARAVWTVTKDADDDDRRIIACLKNNLGKDNLGMAFRIAPSISDSEVPVIEWESEPVSITAMQAFEPSDERRDRSVAAEWLREVLPLPAKEVESQGREAGFSWATLRRAKELLRIKPTKTGFDGGWEWSLPKTLTPAPQGEHLRQDTKENNHFAACDGTEDTEDAHLQGHSAFEANEHLPATRCPECGGSVYWRVFGETDWHCRTCRPTGRTQIELYAVDTLEHVYLGR